MIATPLLGRRNVRALCLLAGLALASLSAHAADESPWVEIAQGTSIVWSAQRGSYELRKTAGGVEVAVVNIQFYDKDDATYEYGKLYVTLADCRAGEGKLTRLRTGGEWMYDTDFNRKGESVGASVGNFICSVWEQDVADRKAKSI